MKNVKIILIWTLSLALLLSVALNTYQAITTHRLNQEIEEYEDSYSPMYEFFSSLTIAEFEQKVADGDDFSVYIGRPDCGDCFSFEPTLIDIIKENNLQNKMYYLNVKWYRAADKDKWNTFKEKYKFTQTPAFARYADGEQKNMIEWDSDKGLTATQLKEWLKLNNII